MSLKPIKTQEDYHHALKRMGEIFDAAAGTPEGDEADLLVILIDEYEKKHYPIEAPDPIEAIKIRMQDMKLKQSDLAQAMGGKSRVSEILNRRRRLTLEMVRNLSSMLSIPAEVLIQDYSLSR